MKILQINNIPVNELENQSHGANAYIESSEGKIFLITEEEKPIQDYGLVDVVNLWEEDKERD